jgi:hypothetical protein
MRVERDYPSVLTSRAAFRTFLNDPVAQLFEADRQIVRAR